VVSLSNAEAKLPCVPSSNYKASLRSIKQLQSFLGSKLILLGELTNGALL
jgi:hypothetical protein